MKIFRRNEDAVSPVIGVILMVAITVILAAVIAAFVFGLGGSQQSAPIASITAQNYPDSSGADLKISHKGGDMLKAKDWKVSIVEVGTAPDYINATDFDKDLSVGNQIIATSITTSPANFSLTEWTISGGSNLTANTKYDVKLVHVPSNAMMLDQVIEVR